MKSQSIICLHLLHEIPEIFVFINHPKKYRVQRASVSFSTSVLFHLLLIQCYISSLVFDLWFLTYDLHTVLCIFAHPFIMYLHGFFFQLLRVLIAIEFYPDSVRTSFQD